MIRLELVTAKWPKRLNSEIEKFAQQIPKLQAALRNINPKPAAKPAPRQKMQVLIQLTSDVIISRLNQSYRGVKGPTDVLSFCYAEKGVTAFSHEPYGEIYISHATALRQARELGHALSYELTVLSVHGALHVLGYDHEQSETGRRDMQKLETGALERLAPVGSKGLISR